MVLEWLFFSLELFFLKNYVDLVLWAIKYIFILITCFIFSGTKHFLIFKSACSIIISASRLYKLQSNYLNELFLKVKTRYMIIGF